MNQKFVRYFDIMARVIRILIDKAAYNKKDYMSVLYAEDSEYFNIIYQAVPELFGYDGRTATNLNYFNVNDDFLNRLNILSESDNEYVLMLLLYLLDRAIDDCFKSLINFEDEVEEVEALNKNVEETDIYILKKSSCRWEPSQIGVGIKEILRCFYYIDMKNIPGVALRNYILDPNLIIGIERNCLRVALSPVSKEKIVEFSAPYKRKNEVTGVEQFYFRVERIRNESTLSDMLLDIMYKAGRKDVDLLIFPEMLGTKTMLDTVLEDIKKKGDMQVPTLIVFPSIWEKTNDDLNNRNYSSVILDGNTILFSQDKYCDFHYFPDGKQPVFEDINRNRNEEKIIHMIHIEGLGRICVVICFDYLDTENRDMIIKNLRPTLVCSPSFSTGSFHFMNLTGKYFSEGCNWIWCNTCSASNETEKEANFITVGAITTLNKKWKMVDEELTKTLYGKAKCDKETCVGCWFHEDIPLAT